MASYFVYELYDPRDDATFYVGKGKGSRPRQHERDALCGVASAKCDKIREVVGAGHSVGVRKIAWFASEQDAYDYEAEHVASFPHGSLTNIAPGGGTARNGPTIKGDYEVATACAEMVNRTRNGAIRWVSVAGERLDLLPILENYKQRVAEVIKRRGHDWVNAPALRFGVQFNGRS